MTPSSSRWPHWPPRRAAAAAAATPTEDDDSRQPRRRLGHHRPRAGQGHGGCGVADTVSYDNKGGAAGSIGLAQFVNSSKGDPNALMIMGAVMLGGIITSKQPAQFQQATPVARLISEYQVFVLPAASPLKTHEGRHRADEEGPWQRQVGRRLARLDRAHRRGHDRARRRASTRRRSTTSRSGAAAKRSRPSWAATSPSAAAATPNSASTSRLARCARSP